MGKRKISLRRRFSALAASFFVKYVRRNAFRLCSFLLFCYNSLMNIVCILCGLFLDFCYKMCYNINAAYI